MATILVVDDSPICREPIAAALQLHGYTTVCAANGREALAVLRHEPPDVILLDVTMPEMDGLAVLRVVRRNPEWKDTPVILLTDRAERKDIVQAAEFNIQGYLLKSNFSLNDLLTRVEACLAKSCTVPVDADERGGEKPRPRRRTAKAVVSALPEREPARQRPEIRGDENGNGQGRVPKQVHAKSVDELAPVITKDDFIKLINKGLELRPLGPTVHNVMAVTGNAQCSADDVVKAVAPDQALSIRLLKLANSPAYARGRPVEGVKEAVQRIGMQGVRSLAATLEVLAQYKGVVSTHLDTRLFWEHSIACGVIASAIAKERKSKEADEFFLWGLIHDVGRLIMLEHVPDQYDRVWETANAAALPLEAVEAKMLLLDHCDVLAKALEHWKFPTDFIAPVVNHHKPIQGIKRLGPKYAEAAATIALADRMAHALLVGCSGNDVVYPLDDLVDFLELPAEVVPRVAETARDETNNLKLTMLARAHEDQWPDYRSNVKDQLCTLFQPLCVSAQPSVDAFAMFCRQLAGESIEKLPNIGVIYLRDSAEQEALSAKCQTEEEARGTANLPVILICDKGSANTEHAWLRSRNHVLLKPPVRIASFVKAVGDLLP